VKTSEKFVNMKIAVFWVKGFVFWGDTLKMCEKVFPLQVRLWPRGWVEL